MIKKFIAGIDLDDILNKLDGQGHRSKVKVTRLHDFRGFSDLSEQIPNPDLWCDVMAWRHDVM